MTRKPLSLILPLTKKWLSNHTGLKWGRRGGRVWTPPALPWLSYCVVFCCELLVLHWLSPLGKSYEGGKEDFYLCWTWGWGGGSTSVHLILWCSLTHKSAHFFFFLCFFFFFFWKQVALSKRTSLCVSSRAVFLFLSIAFKGWNILTSLNLAQHFRLQMNEREAWKLPSNAYIAMVPCVIMLTKSLGSVCTRSKFEV